MVGLPFFRCFRVCEKMSPALERWAPVQGRIMTFCPLSSVRRPAHNSSNTFFFAIIILILVIDSWRTPPSNAQRWTMGPRCQPHTGIFCHRRRRTGPFTLCLALLSTYRNRHCRPDSRIRNAGAGFSPGSPRTKPPRRAHGRRAAIPRANARGAWWTESSWASQAARGNPRQFDLAASVAPLLHHG